MKAQDRKAASRAAGGAVLAYVGLGSNQGDRRAMLERAMRELRGETGVAVKEVSNFYLTAPVGGPMGQEQYLNAVVELSTTLSAEELLAKLLSIEQRLGREQREHWGPRCIDLDLLLYGQAVINSQNLQVPHSLLHEREFMLRGLAEIAPEVRHPLFGLTARQMWSACRALSSAEFVSVQAGQKGGAALISVAGAVGAGKTTLARKLAEVLGEKVLEEEVSGNELLEDFYRDRARYALPVQSRFLLSRFAQLRADCWPAGGMAVADYIFDQDRLFAELNLTAEELEIYMGLWRSVANRVREPDVVIYLQADPDLLLERVRLRDRHFERSMDIGYLGSLTQAYEMMFSNYQTCPVIRVKSASEPARSQQIWQTLLRELGLAVPSLSTKLVGKG